MSPCNLCRCGRPLYSQIERESQMCDHCSGSDPSESPQASAGIRTDRYRCTECQSVLMTEEEEANLMCASCLNESAA